MKEKKAKANLELESPMAALEALQRVRTELKYSDDALWFVFTFLIGNVMGKVGTERAVELLTDLVAAIRTQTGVVNGKEFTFSP